MTNRRQFLERSVLGAGSVLFLPGLLGSCTDHRIPDPDSPIIVPPITDIKLDWNDDARQLVITGLGAVPDVGDILGPLADAFWPKSGEDVWGQVKGQVEAIVNKKIADAVYLQVSEDLKGLKNNIILYRHEVKNGTPSDIKTQWIVTKNLFVTALPHFQSAGNELPLLGLFGQFANLYLALLREGVAFGASWGRSAGDQQQDVIDLKNAISDFTTYADNTFLNGAGTLNTKRDDHACEPFRTINKYTRQMTLTVLDFVETWQYYDSTEYPNGAKNILTREIYSDPYGTCDDSGDIIIPYPYPTQRPTQLTVWGGDRIDAVQLTYPAGSGPKGVTQTPRMGDQPYLNSGGSNQHPFGGVFNLSPANPIIQAKVNAGSVVGALQFVFNDGTTTNILGDQGPLTFTTIAYTNEALSSIYINGVSRFYGTADCVVFGFQFWLSSAATLQAIRTMYVTSPKERSAADFAKAFPELGIPANLITEELKTARRAHWAYIEALAKALK